MMVTFATLSSSLLQMDCEQEVEQSGAITSVNLSTLVADQPQDLMAGAELQDNLEESSSNVSDSSPISHDMVNQLLKN